MAREWFVDNAAGNPASNGLSKAAAMLSLVTLFASGQVQNGDTVNWFNRRERAILDGYGAFDSLIIRHGKDQDWGPTRFDDAVAPATFVLDTDNSGGAPPRKTWKTTNIAGNADVNDLVYDWETRVTAWGGHNAHLLPSQGANAAAKLVYCKADVNRWTWQHSGAVLTWRGAYNAGTAYAVDDAVTFGGKSYRSKVGANVNNQPDVSGAQWEVITLYVTLPAAVDPTQHTFSVNYAKTTGFSIVCNNLTLEVNPALNTEGATGYFSCIVSGTNVTVFTEGCKCTGYGAISIVGTGRILGRFGRSLSAGMTSLNAHGATANATKLFTIQPAANTSVAQVSGHEWYRHGLLGLDGNPLPTAGWTEFSTCGIILHTTGGALFTGAVIEDCISRDKFGTPGACWQLSDGRAPADPKVKSNYGIFLRRCKAYNENVFPITGHLAIEQCDLRPVRATVLGMYSSSGLDSDVYMESSYYIYKSVNGFVGIGGGDQGGGHYNRWHGYNNTLVDLAVIDRGTGFFYMSDEGGTHLAKIEGDANLCVVLNHGGNIANMRVFHNYPYGGANTNFGTAAMRALTNCVFVNIGKPDDLVDYTFEGYQAAFNNSGNVWWMDQVDPFVDSNVGADGDAGDFRLKSTSPLYWMRRDPSTVAIHAERGFNGETYCGRVGADQSNPQRRSWVRGRDLMDQVMETAA